ncbi:hypothetical protein [Methylocella sp.]|uniref:hypothetical protein n=1 Tax=Methylocella sp. TaxID=1978226 RepID=UPI003783CB59
MKHLALAMIGLLAFSKPLLADQTDCIALAKVIAFSYRDSLEDEDYKALDFQKKCSSLSSTQNAGLNILVGALSAGGDYSSTNSSSSCDSDYHSLGIQSKVYKHVQNIITDSLGTINKCLELTANNEWGFRFSYPLRNSISFILTNHNTNGGKVLSVKIDPDGSLTCDEPLPNSPVIVDIQNPLYNHCVRIPKKIVVDGVELESAPDATLSFTLINGNTFEIPLKGYETSILRNINNKIDSLHLNLIINGDPIKADHVKGNPATNFYTVSGACPSNSVIIGYQCEVIGGAAQLQSARLFPNNTFSCDWIHAEDWPQGPPQWQKFGAQGRAVCLSLAH